MQTHKVDYHNYYVFPKPPYLDTGGFLMIVCSPQEKKKGNWNYENQKFPIMNILLTQIEITSQISSVTGNDILYFKYVVSFLLQHISDLTGSSF